MHTEVQVPVEAKELQFQAECGSPTLLPGTGLRPLKEQ